MKKLLPLMALTLPLTACQGALYPWGGYESRLLDYYKAPSDETWTKDMQTVIADAEKHVDQSKTHKVAPGLYAEYGYMLMKKGGGKEALPYFRKERAAWPESAVFMTALERASEGKELFNEPTDPAKPGEPAATDAAKTTSASTEAKPVEAKPVEAKPVEAKSVEAKPAAPHSAVGKPQ